MDAAAGPNLQEQARALGDPTRHAIFRHVAELDHPVGVAELNERFPLNHNAIRQHLAKLVAAHLVVESRAPAGGRGRPRLVYEVDPAAEGQWGTPGPYERLSRLLVEIIRTGLDPEEVGRRAAAQFRPRAASGDAARDVDAAMARHGFSPEIVAARDGTDIVLHRCPFATTALDDRGTICALHLGIAEGLTDGSTAAVSELVALDPRTAGCRLRLRPVEDPAATPSAKLTLRRKSR